MTAITFNTAHQAEHARERFQIAVASLREMIDAFVSNQMRVAAAAAEQARPRRVRDTPSMTEQ